MRISDWSSDVCSSDLAMLAKDPMRTLERAAGEMASELGPQMVKGLTRLLHDLQNRHQVADFGVCQDCSLYCVNETAEGQCGSTGETITTVEQTKNRSEERRVGEKGFRTCNIRLSPYH